MRRVDYVNDFVQDIRYGVRILAKHPGFTLVATITLALGIGANTAIFSLINAVMLRSLPVREPDELVLFSDNPRQGMSISSGLKDQGQWREFSYPFYQYLMQHNQLLQGICAFQSVKDTLKVQLEAQGQVVGVQTAIGKLVSGNYFSVLGVNAVAGRALTPGDDGANAPPVAVVSFNYWKNTLNGNPALVGGNINIDGIPVTLVGIMPPGFFGERVEPDSTDFWLPLGLRPRLPLTALPYAPRDLTDPHTAWLGLIGRLRHDVCIAQANTEVNGELRQYLAGLFGSQVSETERQQLQHQYVTLAPGGRGLSEMRHEYSEPLKILLAIVSLVLLIACANVANLLLSRARARQKEIAVRLALGAERGRLVRQMLAESVLLAVLGGAVGALLAFWGVNVLISLVAARVPLNVKPNLAVFVFTMVVSLLTVIFSGLAPAFKATRVELVWALRAGSREATGAQARIGLGKSLVVFQIAVSLLLLISTGLLIRSLVNLEGQQLGFSPEHVLLVSVDPNLAGYEAKQLPGLYREVVDRIRALPGVRCASIGSESPMSGGGSHAVVSVEGQAERQGEVSARLVVIGPRYFETEGIRIVAGRDISLQDTASSVPVAVINQVFAHRFFPNLNPIGSRFGLGSPFEPPGFEIVGVVEDARYSTPAEKPEPSFFLPVDQIAESLAAYAEEVEVRAVGNAADVATEVRRAIQKIDSNLPITEVTTLSRQVQDSLGQQRTISEVTGFFGFLGLALASVGLYGIVAYNVALRTNEIGIRMALGANRSDVFRLVVGRGMHLTFIGAAAGIAGAFASTRFLSSLLYGIKSTDPFTLIIASLLLVGVAALASYIPARRATKVDPMAALKCD